MRDVFDAVRWLVKAGCGWRRLPHDFPPRAAVYQHARQWVAPGCFEAMAHDLRAVLRVAAGRDPQPTAARPTHAVEWRARDDGDRRRNGSKVHTAADILGHPPAPSRWRRRATRCGPRWPTWDYGRTAEGPAGWDWVAYLTVLVPRAGLQSA